MITVTLNGSEREFEEKATAAQLLELLGYKKSMSSVWVNNRKLLSAEYESCVLNDGDTVKAIRLFGGG